MRKTKIEALKTKEHLMLAALETFYSKGIARSSLNEIAQAAGVTRGALYWHFKNKEDLFDAIFQRIFNDIDAHIEQDMENLDSNALECFRLMNMRFFNRLENNAIHQKFFNVLFFKCEHTAQNHAIIELVKKYQALWLEKLNCILNRCIQDKILPADLDIELAIIYLRSVLDGIIQQWIGSSHAFDLHRVAPPLIDMALDNLQNQPLLRKRA